MLLVVVEVDTPPLPCSTSRPAEKLAQLPENGRVCYTFSPMESEGMMSQCFVFASGLRLREGVGAYYDRVAWKASAIGSALFYPLGV